MVSDGGRPRHWLGRAALLFSAAILASCGEERTYDAVPTYPVTGRFLFQGAPVDGAFVKFTPVEGTDDPGALTSQGETDSEGNFTLSTYEKGDGAPAGRYAVTLIWPTQRGNRMKSRDPGPDRLRRRFADPKRARWTVEITDGENVLEPFVIELSSTSK